jgi:multiple sugar transport system substrate-binding protein
LFSNRSLQNGQGPWEIPYLSNMTDLGFDFDFYPPIVPDDHKGPIYTYADLKTW